MELITTNNGVAPPYKYQFNLTVSANSLTNFNIGASYTRDQIETLAFTWETPKSWEKIIPCMYRGLQRDWTKVRNSICNASKYVLTGIKEAYREGKKVFVLSFGTAIATIGLSGYIGYNQEIDRPVYVNEGFVQMNGNFSVNSNKYSPNSDIEEMSILPSEKKKEVRKYKAKNKLVQHNKYAGSPVLTVNANSTILFNPENPKKLYGGKYVEELLNPVDNGIKKFVSYDRAVLYYWKLIEEHNRTSTQKVNQVGVLLQFLIESNIRPSGFGHSSKLNTYANNGLGLKGRNVPVLMSKDDDYKNGKLVHSGFQIFNNFSECLNRYSEILKNLRYHGQVKEKTRTYGYNVFQHTENSEWESWLSGMWKSGYCTNKEYSKLGSVMFKECKPILDKYKVNYQ